MRLAARFAPSTDLAKPFALAFDEGGVRLEHRGEPVGYLPYELVRDVAIREAGRGARWFGGAPLVAVVDGHDGEVLEIGLEDSRALDAQRVWLTSLSSLREAGSSLREAGSSLREAGSSLREAGSSLREAGSSLREAGSSLREAGSSLREAGTTDLPAALVAPADGDLAAWLGALSGAAGYRTSSLPSREAQRVLADRHAPIASRAAAAFVLLESADGEVLDDALVTFLTQALPPLAVVAASATRGGDALVDAETRAWLVTFLTRAEAEALERVRATTGDDATRGEVIRGALERARTRAEAAVDTTRTLRPTPRGGRSVSSGGYTSGAAWVGRSWAL